jgi:hypothetical protein
VRSTINAGDLRQKTPHSRLISKNTKGRGDLRSIASTGSETLAQRNANLFAWGSPFHGVVRFEVEVRPVLLNPGCRIVKIVEPSRRWW